MTGGGAFTHVPPLATPLYFATRLLVQQPSKDDYACLTFLSLLLLIYVN